MEYQRPLAPYSATYSLPSHYQLSSTSTSPDESDYVYNEKDAFASQQSYRTDRGSKSSSNRGRDSVISHPFSPKASSPPSPSSSVSSAGRRHRSIPEIHSAQSVTDIQPVTYPPQAYLDPEKQAYGSSQGRRSQNLPGGPEADAIVYDQGEYHEKGPEEKAWQLLVRYIPPN